MISIKVQHFGLNRLLLLSIGVWPYQKSKFVRVQLILFYSILITSVIFQFTTLITSKCTMELTTKVLSAGLFSVPYVIQYNSLYLNAEVVKYLLEQLQEMCDELKDMNEIAIIERYGNYGKRYTAGLVGFGILGFCVLTITPFWPDIVDIILPLNESRSQSSLQIMTEYFIDQKRYFYFIMLHMQIASVIGILAVLATGTTLIVYLQHACGMFKIASYRIKHAIKINILQSIEPKNENLVYEGIVHAVDMHCKAMKYSECVISSFNMTFFALIILGIITLSINLFRIFQALSSKNVIEELVLPVSFLLTQYLYMFIANYIAQLIIDHNDDVIATAYNVRWYVTHIPVQRLVLFILQRSAKAFHLNVGGLFIASLDGFATLASATISYFTFLYSTRS